MHIVQWKKLRIWYSLRENIARCYRFFPSTYIHPWADIHGICTLFLDLLHLLWCPANQIIDMCHRWERVDTRRQDTTPQNLHCILCPIHLMYNCYLYLPFLFLQWNYNFSNPMMHFDVRISLTKWYWQMTKFHHHSWNVVILVLIEPDL